jgi:hypothetical protein
VELVANISANGSPRWGFVDATTFRVPDLRGLFLRGVNSGSGRDPDVNARTALYTGGSTGDVVGSYQDSDNRSHQHNFSFSNVGTSSDGNHNHGVNANSGEYGVIRRSSTSDGGITTDGADSGGRGNEPDVVNPPAAIPFSGTHSHTVSFSGVTQSAGGNETRPKNVGVHYFIKY